MTFEDREDERRLENARGRAYRSLLDAGFTTWPDHGSAPTWALRLSIYEHCGAVHFNAIVWPRVWRRAARDAGWPLAFETIVALEDARADELWGQAGSAYEAGKRVAAWIAGSCGA